MTVESIKAVPRALSRTLRWVLVVASFAMPVSAQHSGLSGFSDTFLSDYRSAEKMVDQTKSVEPLIDLQRRYTSPAEQAELEVSIGLLYGQTTGFVDPSKAIAHFTKALAYDLPEKTYIQILMWRGNSQEQLKNFDESLADYLRGLVACSYYDLPERWPEIQGPKHPIFMDDPDPANEQRNRDYLAYRKRLDFQQFLLMQRWGFIDAVKRVRKGKSDTQIVEMLQTLTPESSKFDVIIDQLKSENKRPWP